MNDLETRLGADRHPWMDDALCRQVDTDLFFPEKADAASVRQAKSVCFACSVVNECLDYALANNEAYGVWGMTTARERRRIRQANPDAQHVCDDCGSRFTTGQGRSTHQRIVHGKFRPARKATA